MDGFAVSAGPAAELRVVGESRAGHPAGGRGRAGRGDADLHRRGDARGRRRGGAGRADRGRGGGTVRVPGHRAAATNVRHAGEDVRAGEPRARAPAPSSARPSWAWLASAGPRRRSRCARRPRVAVLVTGDELVEPGRAARPGPDPQLERLRARRAGRARAGGELVRAASACATTADAHPRGARRARSSDADVVCVSGGVSVGPHDHVKPALAALGVEERFWGVRLKPGKPTWFGTRGRHARVRAAGQPGVGDGHLPAVRPPGAARARRARDPDATRAQRAMLDEPVRAQPASASRRCACRLERRRRRLARRAHQGAQGSHVLTSMLGADGARADPAAARARWPPASAWTSSCPVRSRAATPRRLLERRPARRARACTIVRAPRVATAARTAASAAGRVAEVTLPAGRARPDLDARVPRAAGAHLLALPDARLARAAARALHRRTSREIVRARRGRSCCCASTRPSTRPSRDSGTVTWPIDSGLLVAPRGRGRGYLRLGGASASRTTRRRQRGRPVDGHLRGRRTSTR